MITRAALSNLVYLHKFDISSSSHSQQTLHARRMYYPPKGYSVLHDSSDSSIALFLFFLFIFFSYMYIIVQVHYSLSRGKEIDWSLALPRGWVPKLVLLQKQPLDFLYLYCYNVYRKLKNQTGIGLASILFLLNTSFHMACLNVKVFGLSTLVGAILSGCRECW